MRKIPLRRRDGSVAAHALVDDADYEELGRLRWCLTSDGYVQRREYLGKVDGRYRYRAVRLHVHLMGQRGVDHRDGNPLNNQRANLRLATQAQNAQNRRVRHDAASGVRGVSKAGARWKATVGDEYLGCYGTIEEAAAVAREYRAQRMPFSEERAA